ncbi:MAG TPA: hypothetical protein PLI31_09940 [Methanoregulaceae archaeon]|nr:hypothetical protein [Methanoregulaceae archaeon]
MTEDVPFIIPLKIDSRIDETATEWQVIAIRRVPHAGKKGIHLTIASVVPYAQGKRGEQGAEDPGYVVDRVPWKPRKIHEMYRSRFAIGSSYRMRNQEKTRSSTRNPVIRYLFAILSFLLRNLWMGVL